MPNASEGNQTNRHIGMNSFFQECVGFIDGTLIPFAAAPAKHKADYWTWKSAYALKSLLICDDQHRVINAHHRWCGSGKNQWVFKSSLVRAFEVPQSLPLYKNTWADFLQVSSIQTCPLCSHQGNTFWPTLVMPHLKI